MAFEDMRAPEGFELFRPNELPARLHQSPHIFGIDDAIVSAIVSVAVGTAISTVLSLLLPKPPIQGPRLGEQRLTASTYGVPRYLLYGAYRTSGNVIWARDILEKKKTSTEGGIFGIGGTEVTVFKYFGYWAVALCEGPAAAILKVYANRKLIYDVTGSGVKVSSKYAGKFRFYLGTETQEPDALIVETLGAANAPAYRGTVYIIFEKLPLEKFGNQFPQIDALVSMDTDASSPYATVNTVENMTMKGAIWSPDRTRLYVTESNIPPDVVVLDTQSQTILAEADLIDAYLGDTSCTLPAIDALGNLYWSEKGISASNGIVTRFDGVTFAVNGQVDVDLVSSPGNVIGALAFVPQVLFACGPTGDQRILALEGGGPLFCLIATTASGINENFYPELAVTVTGSLANHATGTWSTGMACQDKDGWIWIVAATASDGGLFKMAPTTGEVVAVYTLTGKTNAFRVAYDLETHGLIVGRVGSDQIFRWDIATAAIVATSGSIAFTADASWSSFANGVIAGNLWLRLSSSTFIEFDVETCTTTRTFSYASWNGISGDDAIYDPLTGAVLTHDSSGSTLFYWLFIDRHLSIQVTLRSIVEDLIVRASTDPATGVSWVTTTDFDCSALDGILVQGYEPPEIVPARQNLALLSQFYHFDLVESDWIIKAVLRTAASVATFTEDDLAASDDPDALVPFLTESRTEDQELPRNFDVTFSNAARDYQAATVRVSRISESVKTDRTVTIDVPIAFSDGDEPTQRADILLREGWASRRKYTGTLDMEGIRHDPSDIVTFVPPDGVSRETLLTKVALGANGIVEFEARSRDVEVYTSSAVGPDDSEFVPPTVETIPATRFNLLDLPHVYDSTLPIVDQVFAGPVSASTWPGAELHNSADGLTLGTSHAAFDADAEAVQGSVTTALTDATVPGWDYTGSVTIRFWNGAPATATDAELLAGGNMLVIGDEILSYGEVTSLGGGLYTLGRFLRGLRGTEWAMADHATGERAIIVTRAAWEQAIIAEADVNAARLFRGGTLGQEEAYGTTYTLTSIGRSAMPYAGVNLNGSRGGTLDWTIRWTRRSRVANSLTFSSVALGETAAVWEIDIISPVTGLSVRTITQTASANGSVITATDIDDLSALYDAADQVIDFGDEIAAVQVAIYQLSSLLVSATADGRGFPLEGTVAASGVTVFSDAFTEASVNTILSSHTPNIGVSWTELERTGSVFLRANFALDAAEAFTDEPNDRTHFVANPSPITADYRVSMTTIASSAPTATEPIVLTARVQDASNYYAFLLYNASASPDIYLIKKVAGVVTTLDSDNIGTVVTASVALVLEVSGSSIRALINGAEVLSATDTAITAPGRAGIAVGSVRISTDDIAQEWQSDDFLVQTL